MLNKPLVRLFFIFILTFHNWVTRGSSGFNTDERTSIRPDYIKALVLMNREIAALLFRFVDEFKYILPVLYSVNYFYGRFLLPRRNPFFINAH